MRIERAILVGVAALLAGCASKPNTVARVAEPPPADVPATISYEVEKPSDYDQLARQADDWCRQRYNERAQYLNREPVEAGAVVTFECFPPAS